MNKIRSVRSALCWIILVLALCAIVVIPWVSWPEHRHVWIEGFLGGVLCAALTLILAFIAWTQLRSLSRTTSAQFLIELKRDFFTADNRLLFQLVDSDWLEFQEANNKNAFFRVKEKEISESALDPTIIQHLTLKKAYSTYDVDDCLLGHLEDIGILLEQGILEMEMVYEEFSYYIERTWANSEICKYIESVRVDSPDFYANLEAVAKKCRALE